MRKFIDIVTEAVQPPTSAEFRQWFNGSKIVDNNGNPLVLYHGTKTVFDHLMPKNGSTGTQRHKMIFASESPESASQFAGVMDDNSPNDEDSVRTWDFGHVRPIYMRMVKPFDYTHFPDEVDWAKATDEHKKLRHELGDRLFFAIAEMGDYTHIENDDVLDKLIALGYDGFTAWEAGGMSYACFDSDNVRSVFDFR